MEITQCAVGVVPHDIDGKGAGEPEYADGFAAVPAAVGLWAAHRDSRRRNTATVEARDAPPCWNRQTLQPFRQVVMRNMNEVVDVACHDVNDGRNSR